MADGHTEQLFADMTEQTEAETDDDSIELTTVDNGIVVNSEEETGNEE